MFKRILVVILVLAISLPFVLGAVDFEATSADLDENDIAAIEDTPASRSIPINGDTQSSADLTFEERMMAMLQPPENFIQNAQARQHLALDVSGFSSQMSEMNMGASTWAQEFSMGVQSGMNSFAMPEFTGSLGMMPENFGQFSQAPDISGMFPAMQSNMRSGFDSIASSINFGDIMARNQQMGQSMINAAGMGNFHGQLANIQNLSRHQVYSHNEALMENYYRLIARNEANSSAIRASAAESGGFDAYRNHVAEANATLGKGILGSTFDGIDNMYGLLSLSDAERNSLIQNAARHMWTEIGGNLPRTGEGTPAHGLATSMLYFAGMMERPRIDHAARLRENEDAWQSEAMYVSRNMALGELAGLPQYQVPANYDTTYDGWAWHWRGSISKWENEYGYSFSHNLFTGRLTSVNTPDGYIIQFSSEGGISSIRNPRNNNWDNRATYVDDIEGWIAQRYGTING